MEQSNLRIAVWNTESTSLGNSGGAGSGQSVANVLDASFLITVQIGDHGKEDIVEVVVLNTGNGTHAGVDTGCWGILEAGAVDVGSSESERWETGVDVVPVVVVISDVELASVLS